MVIYGRKKTVLTLMLREQNDDIYFLFQIREQTDDVSKKLDENDTIHMQILCFSDVYMQHLFIEQQGTLIHKFFKKKTRHANS